MVFGMFVDVHVVFFCGEGEDNCDYMFGMEKHEGKDITSRWIFE